MRFASRWIRNLLARKNYVLRREEPEIPPCLTQILQREAAASPSPPLLVCLDGAPGIQSDILQTMDDKDVVFSSVGAKVGLSNQSRPTRPFLSLIDVDACSLRHLVSTYPWLTEAECLIVRSHLGAYWAGMREFGELEEEIRALGFRFVDAFTRVPGSTLQAPIGYLLATAHPLNRTYQLTSAQTYRINEASAFLTRPIAKQSDFIKLTGRGSFSCAAGVFNPGAILHNGRVNLLLRAECVPWARQESDSLSYFRSVRPVLLTLAPDLTSGADVSDIQVAGYPKSVFWRAMDFRLFRYRDETWVNHVVATPAPGRVAQAGSPVPPLANRVGISRLDWRAKELVWLGAPAIDRPLTRIEKNWAMFSSGDDLFLLYSFSPFVLLKSVNWPGLHFQTIVRAELTLPIEGDGLSIRNSINPVDYDSEHWLHVVHKAYPRKQYCFWGVLIHKQSLRPVRITARPLARAWHSYPAAILYLCSVVATDTEVLLFAGIDDSGSIFGRVSRATLDMTWRDCTPQ